MSDQPPLCPDCMQVMEGPAGAIGYWCHTESCNEKSRKWAQDMVRQMNPTKEDYDALKAENARLRKVLKDLVARVDRNGGLGEYKGGPVFVMKHARDLLQS